jgi:GTP-binding protein
MNKPIVAIVGRQNTGKSTLLNRLTGKRIAITADLPGTTRDRIFATVFWRETQFAIVDTGGWELKAQSIISQGINEQVKTAISEADAILFLVDIKDGITPIDLEITDLLRRSEKPVVLVANKADNEQLEIQAVEFFGLGLGEPLIISAYHGRGTYRLLDKIISLLPVMPSVSAEPEIMKVSIVGRPNVGKSTLLNALLGKGRAVVDRIPGTTRDAIDTLLDFNGQDMLLIDTAGIRRRGRLGVGVERYSVIRTIQAIDRSDVVLLVLDTAELVTAQDMHIAGYIQQAAKGIVLMINKWDLAIDKSQAEGTAYVKNRLKFAPYAPVLFVSAKLGQGVDRVIPRVLKVHQERLKRIPTASINNLMQQAVAAHSPPRSGKKQLKFLYSTQAEVNPPTFVFFVNDARLIHFSYKRYLENRLRESFGFNGTPLRLVFKTRGER